ncbi:MAG: TonB family protein [Acidobacteriota bacterium]
MSRIHTACVVTTIAIAAGTLAQTAPLRIGPGVTPPRVIRKVEPEMTALSRADHIQGTVVVQLVVTEKGRAGDIQVISPLGYGLDENAIAAIQKWEFVPGQKDGHPVPIMATVEVNFRFVGAGFDEAYERRRTEFNVALAGLRNATPAGRERRVETMLNLARRNFPGALYLVGMWETTGEVAPTVLRNSEAGWLKIEQAAKKNYGPAIYQVAKRSLDNSENDKRAWEGVRRAAVLGSREAQLFLGDRYQRGDGLEMSIDRAKNYDAPNRPDYEYEQALAWFGLAADHGIAGAREIVERETPNLTPAQSRTIATLKRQFAGSTEPPQ